MRTLTFARASVASRVNSSGLVEMVGRTLSSELVTCGDFSCADPNDYWDLEVSWSIVDGKLKSDGTFGKTAFQENIFSQAGSTYKIKFDVNVISGSLSTRVRMGDPINGHTTISNITSEGSYTLYATAVANQDNLNFTTLSDNTAVYTIDNVSVKQLIDTNNIPRISYDSNGDNGHILLEPTSTNLVTYSEDFSQSYWSKSSITVTDGFTSPSGDLTASKFTEGSTNINHQIYRAISGTAGTTYTLSGFFKKGERDIVQLLFGGAAFDEGAVYCNFDLENGVLGSGTYLDASITLISNGWYRCSFTATKTTTGNFNITYCPKLTATSSRAAAYLGNGTSGIYAYGAQLEALPYATSYIPTLTGSTVTRATETATGAGSADLINSTEGVLYAEIAALVDDFSFRTISLSDGTTSNRCVLRYGGTTNRVNVLISSGGSIIFDNNFTLTEITDFSKIAVKWKLNDFALWVDGVERATDSSGAAPIGLSQLQLSNYNSSSNDFYGKCKALAVFNEALSDDELHNLTG